MSKPLMLEKNQSNFCGNRTKISIIHRKIKFQVNFDPNLASILSKFYVIAYINYTSGIISIE